MKASISPFQYIITNDTKTKITIDGSIETVCNNMRVFVHQSNQKNLITYKDGLFFGECFDFENPSYTNQDIVESISQLPFEEKLEKLNRLTGFFIFIFFHDNSIRLFNDASGQLETYIYHRDRLVISSQANLIPLITQKENEYKEHIPQYIIDKNLTIFNTTPFKYIDKLLPNFYYNASTKEYHRFFPYATFTTKNSNEIAEEAQFILEKTIESITNRGQSAMAITAGWDSRILFASSMKHDKNINYYVLNHKTEDAKIDIKIAQEIIDTFSKTLHIIDYDLSTIEGNHLHIINKENEKAHKISILMQNRFPNHYIINGNVSEIARNFFDPLPTRLTNMDIAYILGLQEGTYEENIISNWRKKYSSHLHLLDAIYWEHKMPNWAGSTKSISNLYSCVISPFNNRYLLHLLLSSPRTSRDKYTHTIYQKILRNASEQLTNIKINPSKKNKIILFMKRIHFYPLYRKLFFRLRKLKF